MRLLRISLKQNWMFFIAIYNYSEIESLYVPENELFRQLLADSVNLIIASRYLNEQELRV